VEESKIPGYARIPAIISILDLRERIELIPSQGSGSVLEARSSIENLMS